MGKVSFNWVGVACAASVSAIGVGVDMFVNQTTNESGERAPYSPIEIAAVTVGSAVLGGALQAGIQKLSSKANDDLVLNTFTTAAVAATMRIGAAIGADKLIGLSKGAFSSAEVFSDELVAE